MELLSIDTGLAQLLSTILAAILVVLDVTIAQLEKSIPVKSILKVQFDP